MNPGEAQSANNWPVVFDKSEIIRVRKKSRYCFYRRQLKGNDYFYAMDDSKLVNHEWSLRNRGKQ